MIILVYKNSKITYTIYDIYMLYNYFVDKKEFDGQKKKRWKKSKDVSRNGKGNSYILITRINSSTFFYDQSFFSHSIFKNPMQNLNL